MPVTVDSTVWLADGRTVSEEALSGYLGWLNQDELKRYARFVRPGRQRQFIIGRILLRQAFGALFGISASKVDLAERPGDGPVLVWPRCSQAGLSISHSGAWVACAVSASTRLGLDIEVIDRDRDVMALAQQAFGAEQAAWLAARPPASIVPDFYDMWCRQEARIKLKAEHGHAYKLPHPELAAVLCSATRLTETPALRIAVLPGMPGGEPGYPWNRPYAGTACPPIP